MLCTVNPREQRLPNLCLRDPEPFGRVCMAQPSSKHPSITYSGNIQTPWDAWNDGCGARRPKFKLWLLIDQVHEEISFALSLLLINYSFKLHFPQTKEYFTIHTHWPLNMTQVRVWLNHLCMSKSLDIDVPFTPSLHIQCGNPTNSNEYSSEIQNKL